jgi:predicted RNA binding protein YcfA (HicA-like mRNA interferase family)/predicted RNase H-like HicB family nuclease
MKVSDVLRMLQDNGWYLHSTQGSHRQFKHPAKPGRVTVAGKPSDDLASGTLKSILKHQAWESRVNVMRYAIVIEAAGDNYSAYAPDLPGCVATGSTPAETETAIREAIGLHLEGMREDGEPIPPASSRVEYVEVTA